MDLHGNAALSWSGRRLLARRVVEQGWTLSAAAEAAGVSVRCARKWVSRYRAGDRQLFDRSSAPRRLANRTDSHRVEVIVKLRRLRMTAAEIAETLAMPLSTVSGILTRSGMGRLGRLGLEPAVRYERSRPGELVHVDIKKLGRIAGAGHRITGDRSSQNRRHHRRARANLLGVRAHRRRRLQPPRLRRGATRRESDYCRRLPTPSCRLLPPLRHPRRGDPQRQRPRLHLDHARACLPAAERPSPTHPAAAATNKRESRALHTHDAQRLGLRRHLRLKPRTHPSP